MWSLIQPWLLRNALGLMSAEALVAMFLAQGRRSDETAAELGISTHTARTHLKRIFSKTQTTRQAELVHLLMALQTGPLMQDAMQKKEKENIRAR